VQVVALNVADQLAVEVELVQVAAAVVQVIEVLAVGNVSVVRLVSGSYS
jgi:hypothetical protein